MGEDGIDEALGACRDVGAGKSKLPQPRNGSCCYFPF